MSTKTGLSAGVDNPRPPRAKTWHFGDRDRASPARLESAKFQTSIPVSRNARAETYRTEMTALASDLPEHIRLGTVGYRYPQWGGLVFKASRSIETIATSGLADYGTQPLFGALGLRSREIVPNERDLLWELLQLPERVTPLVMMNPGLTTPVFSHRRLLDAENGDKADAGHFNPGFLDPRLFRDEIVPILRDVSAVQEERELLVILTLPALLEEAGIPPYPLLWRLERLATVIPDRVRIAVELREPQYLTDDYQDFLRETGWLHVVSTWPGMPALADQWHFGRQVHGVRAAPRLVRLAAPRPKTPIAGFSLEAELHRPQTRQRAELANLLRTNDGCDSIVIASNAYEGCAPLSVKALAERLIDPSVQSEASE